MIKNTSHSYTMSDELLCKVKELHINFNFDSEKRKKKQASEVLIGDKSSILKLWAFRVAQEMLNVNLAIRDD